MSPEEAAILTHTEAEEDATSVEAVTEEEEDEAEDFNPLGHIEGWSAFECSSGPFGFRG